MTAGAFLSRHICSIAEPPDARRELGLLRRTWRRIRAMLSDAEEVEIREESMKFWLQDLKSLAHDAENVLDLCKHEVIRAEVDRGRGAEVDKVRDPAPCLFLKTSFRIEIAELVQRFWEGFGFLMEKKFRNGVNDCDSDDDGDEGWMFQPVARLPSSSDPPTKQQIFGRDAEMDKLMELLISDDDESVSKDVEVIALVGAGGIGKTSLVRNLYDQPKIRQHFDVEGWVCVSTDFDLVRITREVVHTLTKSFLNLVELDGWQKALKRAVEGRRFLLILDDVWNENGELWDRFKCVLRFGAIGSRVLITTRDRLVANTVRARKFMLGYLSEEHGWSLFKQCAFGSCTNMEVPHYKVQIGQIIVRKCKGLPLAIKVIGSLLRYEDRKQGWKEVSESELWKIQGGVEEILGPLQLSYLYLPANLKPCFVYCSMFPKDRIIDKEELVQLWMVEGIIHDTGGTYLLDIGMEYIEELILRSFFQPGEACSLVCGGEEVTSVLIHDLIHDLANHVSRGRIHTKRESETLAPFDDVQCKSSNSSKDITKIQNFLGHHTFVAASDLNFQGLKINKYFEHIQARSLDLSKIGLHEFPVSIANQRIIRYLSIKNNEIETLPEFICTLYNLQVLNLSDTLIKELPSSIGNLRQLCHLVLKNTRVKKLPESVCTLHHLQLMDLSSTRIKDLPCVFGSLRNLCHCILHRTKIGVLPKTFYTLYKLHVLDLSSNRHIEELPNSIGKLKCLRRVVLCATRLKRLPRTLCMLYNLQALDLSNTDLEDLPDSIGNLKKLRYFSAMATKIGKLPESICMLFNLQVLELSHTYIKELPSSIGKLTSLQRFILLGTRINRLPDSICMLHNLQILELSKCPELRELPPNFGNLTNLQYFSSEGIAYLPAGFGRLSRLQTLKQFRVGITNEHAGLAELEDLINLDGSLSITGLCNVLNTNEAKVANLKNKPYLEELIFDWIELLVLPRDVGDEEIASHEEELLEGLQPHTNLKTLHILRFGGRKFPRWLGHPSFTKLVSISICYCARSVSVPSLTLLPSLKNLTIRSMQLLTEIDQQGCGFERGTQISHSISLDIGFCPQLRSLKAPELHNLEIYRCQKLESIEFQGSSMSCLNISDCPQLNFSPQAHLPLVYGTVTIDNCPFLVKQQFPRYQSSSEDSESSE